MGGLLARLLPSRRRRGLPARERRPASYTALLWANEERFRLSRLPAVQERRAEEMTALRAAFERVQAATRFSARRPDPDEIVAWVGGEPLTEGQILERYGPKKAIPLVGKAGMKPHLMTECQRKEVFGAPA